VFPLSRCFRIYLLIKIFVFFVLYFLYLFFCSKDIATEGGQDGARSKGWGRVKFATPAGRQRAIQALNQSNVGGRQLEVRLDRQDGGVSMPFNGNNMPFNQQNGGGGGGGGRGGNNGGAQNRNANSGGRPQGGSGQGGQGGQEFGLYVGNLCVTVLFSSSSLHAFLSFLIFF